jgi:hypothetical protein
MSRHRNRFLAAIAGLLLLAGTGGAAAQSTIRCESQGGGYRSCAINTAGGVSLSRQLSSQGCWQNDTWGYDRNRIWVNRGCRAEFRVGSSHNSHNGNDGAKVAGALVLGAIAAAAIANKDHDNDRHDYNNHYSNGYYNDPYYNNNGNYNGGYYGGREIRCESTSGRYTRCGYIGRGQHVEVRRQLSNSSCMYGRSWGVDDRQLWVDDGCRAVFVVN